MTVTRQRAPIRLRNRLAWTVVLVLIALGGAGLVSAADRPATDDGRPELTAHADALARPWLLPLAAQAREVAADVDTVNSSGRTILGLAPGANTDEADAALSAGDGASADLDTKLAALVAARANVPAGLDPVRMGVANRDLLASVDQIAAGAAPVSRTWRRAGRRYEPGDRAVRCAGRPRRLSTHGRPAAGGNADWVGALNLLAQASGQLQLADGLRDQLAAANDVGALDDLLDNYAAYDTALTDLYTAVREGTSQDSQHARDLAAAVVAARAQLPADRDALQRFVADFAGATISGEVVDLETARGTIDTAADKLP